MKSTKLLLTLAALLAAVPVMGGGNQVPKKEPARAKVDELMKRKLENAQKVLEGVALNEFEKIIRHAEVLILISQKAEWKAVRNPEYELQSDLFRRNAQTLVKHAKAKNADGAALAYVELTMSCVKCHKLLREVRMTHLDRPGQGAENSQRPAYLPREPK